MDWKKAPLVALLLVPVAVAAQLPDPGEEQEVWRLIQACDTNNNGRLTCDEVKACNNGSRLTVTKSERPALYHLMVDGDDDGQVCEGGPDPDPTGQVVFGLGMATGLKDHSLAENGVRPVLLASYLIRRKPEKKIRPGLMAVLDSELLNGSEVVKTNGLGVGLTVMFRGGSTDKEWARAFGIGVAYTWEAVKASETAMMPAVDTTTNSLLFVVTYSIGKQPRLME